MLSSRTALQTKEFFRNLKEKAEEDWLEDWLLELRCHMCFEELASDTKVLYVDDVFFLFQLGVCQACAKFAVKEVMSDALIA